MLGELLKNLRESKGMLQRQVAAKLNIDTALVSKFEHNEKPVSRARLMSLCKLYGVSETELRTHWLAEKIKRVMQDEPYCKEALKMVLKELNA